MGIRRTENHIENGDPIVDDPKQRQFPDLHMETVLQTIPSFGEC
jgi:hypothetical protein